MALWLVSSASKHHDTGKAMADDAGKAMAGDAEQAATQHKRIAEGNYRVLSVSLFVCCIVFCVASLNCKVELIGYSYILTDLLLLSVGATIAVL